MANKKHYEVMHQCQHDTSFVQLKEKGNVTPGISMKTKTHLVCYHQVT